MFIFLFFQYLPVAQRKWTSLRCRSKFSSWLIIRRSPPPPPSIIWMRNFPASSRILKLPCHLLNGCYGLTSGLWFTQEQGYPPKVVVAGDQQSHSLVTNLMKKYPDSFSWIIPMPGDWHFIEISSRDWYHFTQLAIIRISVQLKIPWKHHRTTKC